MNKHIYGGIRRHIFRHMTRATVKSILVIVVTFAVFLTQGWLQETINRNETEIARLYEAIDVFGQIVPNYRSNMPIGREEGEVIRRQTIDSLIESGVAVDIYFEALTPWALVTSEDDDMTILNETLAAIAGDSNVFQARQHREVLNELIAIDDLALFISRHTSGDLTQVPGVETAADNVMIEFAPEFDQDSFVYTADNLDTPIPVILSDVEMMINGFELGDIVSIGYDLNLAEASRGQIRAVIIGYHHGTAMTQTILVPLSAWEVVHGDYLGFTTLEFIVDPVLNRELPAVIETIEEITSRFGAGFMSLILDLQDEELRFVVQPMEETLSLLGLLYPVVIIVSMLIAAGLSFFLTLQNAKNVAVMRIFGATKKRAGLVLWIEQVILCLSGLALGLGLLIGLGWGFGVLGLLLVAGLYLIGVMIGSAAGIFTITRQSPLELLQVKE